MSFTVGRPTERVERPRNVPGLFDSIAAPLGQGLGEGINKGITGALQQSALQRALGMINPESSALDQYMQVAPNVDPETMATLKDQYFPLIEQQRKAQGEYAKLNYENQLKKELESHKKELEHADEPQKIQNANKAWQSQLSLLKKGNLGNPITTGGALNRDRQRDIGQFTSNNAALEQLYVKKINPTGQISNERFQYIIKGILPQPGLSDEENYGRLVAIADELGFDKSEIPEVTGLGGKGFSGAISKITGAGQAQPVEKSAAKAGAQKFVINEDTGEVYVSNGKTWQKVNQ